MHFFVIIHLAAFLFLLYKAVADQGLHWLLWLCSTFENIYRQIWIVLHCNKFSSLCSNWFMVILCEYYTFLVHLGYLSPLGLLWCNTQNDKHTGTMTEGATNST